ncbi:NRDE family protein [Flavobacterium channae]|uniref:NRDE family protein n=1 Tax=Flavobacterium channae TaxID=2897181 RepID=UPI001E521507|nr:NRDE family protein [Flavobacterium channae]UGS22872.1 NRDE family protein [Flavobacterium channae]
MCTVTYIPTSEGCIITSNRDEKTTRKRAIPPQEYTIEGKKITFPKDPNAGGTWIAHDLNKIIVLLNGAQEKHISKNNYRKSRGLIVLELMISDTTLDHWNTIDLTDIEPFTIVCFENNNLIQLQWNEVEKTQQVFDAEKPHIWSSSTLYSKEIRLQRENWFHSFMVNKANPSPDEILHFHQFTEAKNKEFGLQINRDNLLKTISITQCQFYDNSIKMNYLDLLD